MEYSIVLTKAAFVHAKYLELYSSGSGSDKRVDARVGDDGSGDIAGGQRRLAGSAASNWSVAMVDAMVKTRAYVDSHRNCEDIAMQMVSGRTGRERAALLSKMCHIFSRPFFELGHALPGVPGPCFAHFLLYSSETSEVFLRRTPFSYRAPRTASSPVYYLALMAPQRKHWPSFVSINFVSFGIAHYTL